MRRPFRERAGGPTARLQSSLKPTPNPIKRVNQNKCRNVGWALPANPVKEMAMFRRTLLFASALLVLVSAVIINLAILDIIPLQELRESLRKLIAVMAVSTIALILIHKLYGLATPPPAEKNSDSLLTPGSSKKGERSGQREG
jgi:hypothetical protein